MSDDVTLGEVHRLCLEIRADVKAQNGRVSKHDAEIAVLTSKQAELEKDHSRLEDSVASTARNHGAAWGGVIGSAIAGFMAAHSWLGGGK
jgi:hypothetical protein